MKQWMILAALVAASGTAGAQQIWRCGNSYSQQPCPGGRAIESVEPAQPADAARAEASARRDAERADAMERARLEQERRAQRYVVVEPSPAASQSKKHPAARHVPRRPEPPASPFSWIGRPPRP
jgi:hypothetical protein